MHKTEASETSQPVAKRAWLNPGLVHLNTEVTSAPNSTPNSTPTESQDAPPIPANPNHTRARHQLRPIVAVATATLLILGSIGGLYLRSHSLEPVSIASLSATRNVNDPLLRNKLSTAAATYRLGLQTPDGKVSRYALTDMGLKPDISATLKSAAGQHGLAFWKTTPIPLKIKVDQAKYIAFLRTHTSQASVPASDANLVVDGGKVAITAEKDGQGDRVENASTTVLATAGNLTSEPLLLTPGAIGTYIKSTALQTDKAQIERVLKQPVSLKIGSDSITPKASDIARWLTLSPDYANGTVVISVNQDTLRKYIEDVATPYAKAADDTVTPLGDDGSISIVQRNGTGTIDNEDAIVDNWSAELLKAKGLNTTVAISGTAAKVVKAYAQPKWLLVNLTTKRMYAYENTKLVRSFLVSAGAITTPTVQGTYRIYAKYASQDMRGANADGTNYFQPHVQYINYFYKDYAVHGNYWRPVNYFGNINSSHGCVGIVNTDAAWIYDWAPIGTTVMVHV